MAKEIEKDWLDKMMDEIEKNPTNNAQEVLDRGHAATYENDEGLLIEEFPDGRIFHIDVDLKTGKTIYLKQLKSVDGKVMTGEEWLKNNPPLETPTFFSTQKD